MHITSRTVPVMSRPMSRRDQTGLWHSLYSSLSVLPSPRGGIFWRCKRGHLNLRLPFVLRLIMLVCSLCDAGVLFGSLIFNSSSAIATCGAEHTPRALQPLISAENIRPPTQDAAVDRVDGFGIHPRRCPACPPFLPFRATS